MNQNKMTFHESFGELPLATFRLIRKNNVSPADFDLMTDLLGNVAYQGAGRIDWSVIDNHIKENSTTGYYIPRHF